MNRPIPPLDSLTLDNTRMVARFLRDIDDGLLYTRGYLASLWERAGNARVIGITGPPGAGKSTLVSRLVKNYRGADCDHVAVLALDPTSPFSGGAILADRIRMGDHFTDPGVFIRSLATRGATGGLSAFCQEQVVALDALGFDPIIVETVGVGQDETDVMDIVGTTVVLSVPGLGDAVQTMKAGLLEIADIHCVNKGDQPGAIEVVGQLESLVAGEFAGQGAWDRPVVSTVATTGEGVAELSALIDEHQRHRHEQDTKQDRRNRRLLRYVIRLAERELSQRLLVAIEETEEVVTLWREVLNGTLDPYSFLDRVLPPGP